MISEYAEHAKETAAPTNVLLQLAQREVDRSGMATAAIPGMIGTSPSMRKLAAAIRRVARSSRPALITGPTGSGKELVARAIHSQGTEPDAPLIDINCGAIPEGLMESQLFGHERGAFTGADNYQAGYLTSVGNGTLFLDEIAELPLGLQAKLLRVLETSRFRAVGSMRECRFNGRIVAATHADLKQRVADGCFREDLFYRLNVLEIHVPALSERPEDIPLLLQHFAAGQQPPIRFTAPALDTICAMSFPGNVRQLRNLVDRIAVFSDFDLVTVEVVRAIVSTSRAPASPTAAIGAQQMSSIAEIANAILRLPCANKLDAIEQAVVNAAMSLTDANKSAAARILGVHRKVIQRKLNRPEPDPTSD